MSTGIGLNNHESWCMTWSGGACTCKQEMASLKTIKEAFQRIEEAQQNLWQSLGAVERKADGVAMAIADLRKDLESRFKPNVIELRCGVCDKTFDKCSCDVFTVNPANTAQRKKPPRRARKR